jgi:signal transduction histidine kinase
MAKSGKERSAKAAEKRIQYDEKELRHRVRLGTRQKLDELMVWNDIEEINEAVQNLILNAHALGPALSYQAIESPRHKLQISENVARLFRNESFAEYVVAWT